ncbi:MAG TPA: Coq4 family protein [Rhizomicrobium sp.]|jgi:ubiquinone biosynthesis protein COQ4|nr:Coq4 family protein [Rhizomicrobium sp.]
MTETALPTPRRDWPGAVRAVRQLLADPNDTHSVFRVMAALNAGTSAKNYQRLLRSAEGGRIAYRRPELIERLMDRAWLATFAPGTVGAAYRGFLEKTGYSADGLKAVGDDVHGERQVDHPYAWMGRRERDLHDIWHVLTGYKADDPLGELCLVAFSYAQTGGLGWGFIALAGALKSLRETGGRAVRRAVWEGYAHGRAAAWLHAQDIETLFAEPLEAARTRLNIAPPLAYGHAQAQFDAWAATQAAAAA